VAGLWIFMFRLWWDWMGCLQVQQDGWGYQNPRVLPKSGWGELVAFFPDGHNFKPEVNYYLGKEVKSAIIPITPTRAYWFVC
jgi:hypothetical protein